MLTMNKLKEIDRINRALQDGCYKSAGHVKVSVEAEDRLHISLGFAKAT